MPPALVGKSFPSVAVQECLCLYISGPPVREEVPASAIVFFHGFF